tara:strand:+ start:1152 stop:1343 length:192 start_codon:yes stop_codon:yes gene_type:complete
VLLARKPSGIVLISLLSKILQEKGWNERDKGKTKTREHKDLQNGQFGVIVQEAGWNRVDIVTT